MKPPMFVRSLSDNEQNQLLAGLRSRKAFTVRRCQILLASSRGGRVSKIANNLGCATQTVRNGIGDFNASGPLWSRSASLRLRNWLVELAIILDVSILSILNRMSYETALGSKGLNQSVASRGVISLASLIFTVPESTDLPLTAYPPPPLFYCGQTKVS